MAVVTVRSVVSAKKPVSSRRPTSSASAASGDTSQSAVSARRVTSSAVRPLYRYMPPPLVTRESPFRGGQSGSEQPGKPVKSVQLTAHQVLRLGLDRFPRVGWPARSRPHRATTGRVGQRHREYRLCHVPAVLTVQSRS